MSSLPGILTLQDAMNSADIVTTTSLDRQQLELGALDEYKPKVQLSDNYPRYHQAISYGGMKLNIQVPATKLPSLIYGESRLGASVLVPISNWMQQQLEIINMFIRDNVLIPADLLKQWPYKAECFYKPIFDGMNMYIVLGKFCRYTQSIGKDLIVDIPCNPRPTFGPGRYSFTVELPHVYIGPHKGGFLYSVNFRIIRIHYEPDESKSIVTAPMTAETSVLAKDKVCNQQKQKKKRRVDPSLS